MKHSFKIVLATLMVLLLFACQEEDQEFGDVVVPTNLSVSYDIVGVDADNPYGDGSGFVNFTASAENAITFRYEFGDNSSTGLAPSGDITHRFFSPGINTYTVTVIASGTGGVTSSKTVTVEVFSSFDDVEAKAFLTGASTIEDADGNLSLNLDEVSSKTWFWAADEGTHVGLGPVEDDYGNGEFAYEAWWNSIGPFDEEKSCMYVNEFVFSTTLEGAITYEQTVGPAFVPGAYADIIGVDGDACYGDDVATSMFGLKFVAFLPSSSKAATEGMYNGNPYRQTSFQISDGGFMGWYVGSSIYDIISISDTEMRVRIIQEGGGFAWYAKYQTDNPLED